MGLALAAIVLPPLVILMIVGGVLGARLGSRCRAASATRESAGSLTGLGVVMTTVATALGAVIVGDRAGLEPGIVAFILLPVALGALLQVTAGALPADSANGAQLRCLGAGAYFAALAWPAAGLLVLFFKW